jgi:pyruvate,water dikinase
LLIDLIQGCRSGLLLATLFLDGKPWLISMGGDRFPLEGGPRMEGFIYGFEQLRKEDNEKVGKKCANLGELTRAGFRVPPGFALTLDAYAQFMKESGLIAKIEQFFGPVHLDPNIAAGIAGYEEASRTIRKMVEEAKMPADIEAAIREHYEELCQRTGVAALPVSTRSAGPASHPGQYETYLHIRGASEVVQHVKKVWSSTFNARSLIARARQNLPLAYDPIGVAVLKMVNAKAAGIMFTMNPVDGDQTKIYIESNWGLGESVVAGEVTPDSFLVGKASREILKRTISPKTVWYVPDPKTGYVSSQPVPEEKRNKPSVSDEEILELATLGLLTESHFGVEQDVEWAVDSDLPFPENTLLLQTRPVKQKVQKKSPTDKIIDLMMRGVRAR